jgi:hypothetical protein
MLTPNKLQELIRELKSEMKKLALGALTTAADRRRCNVTLQRNYGSEWVRRSPERLPNNQNNQVQYGGAVDRVGCAGCDGPPLRRAFARPIGE